MTDQSAANLFLDVPALLQRSIPRAPGRRFAYVAGAFFIMLIFSLLASAPSAPLLPQFIAIVGMLGLIVAMGIISTSAARSARREQNEMQAAEELIQLRRWDQAAIMLDNILSRPARSPQARVQMLLYLCAILARYHRYTDVIAVYDHLLELDYQDEHAVHALRLGRAMSILHDDRLYDADRAIIELRRDSAAPNSAGLALVEIYRDVKTGHPREAIDLFHEKLPLFRRHIGHRIADAYALVARAYDLLQLQPDAQAAYESATLLIPEPELHRRYTEVAALAGRYHPASIPTEAP
ncbi:MAG: hypothetical protein NTU53_12490 [Planctomycetota bacterium]|nr:hypothetical protein [Planctomycetota bacterium]